MRGRRGALVAAATLLALAVPGVASSQTAPQQIVSPAANAVLTSGADLLVQVNADSGGLFPDAHVVRMRLGTLSGQVVPGSSEVPLECDSGPCDGPSQWAGPTLDPTTMAPFGSDLAGCNGGYTVLASVDGQPYAGHQVRIAVPPAAPSGVAVEPGELTATVTWAKPAQRDISGYRIQRRVPGGTFATIGEVGPGAASFADDDAPEGELEYRVVTLRPDGVVDGSTVAPCADTGKDLTAASAPAATTVEAPAPEEPSEGPSRPSRPSPTDPAEPEPEPGDDGSDPTDGGSEQIGGGGSDGGTGTGTGDDGAEPEGEDEGPADDGAESEADDSTDGGTPRRRVSPPGALGTIDAPGADVGADEPTVSAPRDVFYGEDLGFSEEIDFGEADAVGSQEPQGTTTVETQTVRIPGAFQSMLGEELELDRLLGPVATGLLLLTISVHLRRWSRAVI